jgi:hypothetical protein
MVMDVAQTYTEFGDMPEPQAPEPEPELERRKVHGGNGSTREPEMAETVLAVDAVAAGMGRAAANEEELAAPAEEEANSEAEEPKGPLAKRIAARREKRRARKAGGGGSLSDRLRGLVADRAET